MITFLPSCDFKICAKILDYRRLGKQRVEAKQIIDVLEGKSTGWANHPAVKMWIGYTDALKSYYNAIVTEWISRGYKNNMVLFKIPEKFDLPWFIGVADFHYSHQSVLYGKDKGHYGPLFYELSDKWKSNPHYLWPVKKDEFRVI